MEWAESLKQAVQYIENHLLEDMGVEEVAAAAYISPFYFQKGFHIMTGYTVSEYIRQRRLYLAAVEAAAGREKIIDLAYKYGYQTPESFTKAFSRFHGITPVQIKGRTADIRVFLPLKITISIQGGNDMDYTMEQMGTIPMIGFERKFRFDNSYGEIPKFWSEYHHNWTTGGYSDDVLKVVKECMVGEFGICIDEDHDSGQFSYYIAGAYHGGPVPQGMTQFELPAALWAKFKCVGPLPGSLQSVNTRIFSEWLPGNGEYEIAEDISVEWYTMADTGAADYESGIWIPVRKK